MFLARLLHIKLSWTALGTLTGRWSPYLPRILRILILGCLFHFFLPANHLLVSYIDFSRVFFAEELYSFDIIICITFAVVTVQTVELLALWKSLSLPMRCWAVKRLYSLIEDALPSYNITLLTDHLIILTRHGWFLQQALHRHPLADNTSHRHTHILCVD